MGGGQEAFTQMLVTSSYLPVQRRFFDKHVHGVEEEVRIVPEGPERVHHHAADQTGLRHGLHQTYNLTREPEGNQLRHW